MPVDTTALHGQCTHPSKHPSLVQAWVPLHLFHFLSATPSCPWLCLCKAVRHHGRPGWETAKIELTNIALVHHPLATLSFSTRIHAIPSLPSMPHPGRWTTIRHPKQSLGLVVDTSYEGHFGSEWPGVEVGESVQVSTRRVASQREGIDGGKERCDMSTGVELVSEGKVRVLKMDGEDVGQNRITPAWMEQVNRCLDAVEREEEANCLVTIGNHKFYSTGLDLKILLHSPESARDLIERFHALLARMMAFPKLTVAAVSGHAVAGGAMFALAHDYAVVVPDKLVFFSEINIGIPFTPGMQAMVQSKVSDTRGLRRDLLLVAKKYTGKQAVQHGIFDEVHEGGTDADLHSAMVAHAVDLVGRSGLQTYLPNVLQAIKEEMYRSALHKLRNGGLGYGLTAGRMSKM